MDETELKEMQKELEDLRKAKAESNKIKQELADLKKAKEEQAQKDMTDVVKGFTFVTDEEQADVVKSLLADEGGVLITVLEKARKALAEMAEKELGSDDEGEVLSDTEKANNRAAAILAARYKTEQ